MQIWTYPALVSALGRNQKPSFAELRGFVERTRRESGRVVCPEAMRRAKARRLVAAVLN